MNCDLLLESYIMRIALVLVAAFLETLIPYASLSAGPASYPRYAKLHSGVVHSRPQVVENGSDLALFNFTGNVATAVTFGPDGSSYSLTRNGILKVAPNGSQTFPFAEGESADSLRPSVGFTGGYQNIVYGDGYLWFKTHLGIYRIRPDGTQGRYFQFGVEKNGFDNANDIVAGPDGLYFTAVTTSFITPDQQLIGRIGYRDFKLTLFQLPAAYSPQAASGPTLVPTSDGHVDYLANYYSKQSPVTSLLQIQPDNTSKVLGSAPGCVNIRNAVVVLGAIFYVGEQNEGNGVSRGLALCRATLSGKIGPVTPTVASSTLGQIAADNSGDLWTVNLFGNGLYSYNVVAKQLVGSYEPSILNYLDSAWLYVGPDQNVWLFGYYATNQLFYGAYVRHEQVFTPTSLALNSVSSSAEFLVSEAFKSAPWTAVSTNPAVATVTPASSLVGRFHVSRVGAGATTIAVTDAYGNVSYETVTSN